MASKEDCNSKEAASDAVPATDVPQTSEGGEITGFPRIKLIKNGSSYRPQFDFNDMTGVDPALYTGLGRPKGITFMEWSLAHMYGSAVPRIKRQFERMEAAKKANK